MLMQIVGPDVDIKKKADRLLKCSEAYKQMDVKLNEDHPTSEFYLQYWCWVVPRDDAGSCIIDDDDVFDIEEWRVHLADFTQESRNEDFHDPDKALRSFISEKIQSDDTAEIDSIIDCLLDNMILPRNNPGRGRPPVNKSWNKDYACWVVDDPQEEEQDKYADVNADLRQLYEDSYKKPFDQKTAQTKFNQVLEKNHLSVDELKEASILPYSHISDRSDFVGAYLDTDLACMVKRDMRKRSRSEVQSKQQQPKRSRIETPPKEQEEPNKKIRQELVVTQVLTQFRIMLGFFNEQKTLLTVLKNNIKMMEKLVNHKHKEMFQLTLNQIESFAELAMSEASDEMQRHSVQAFIGTIKLVKEYFK